MNEDYRVTVAPGDGAMHVETTANVACEPDVDPELAAELARRVARRDAPAEPGTHDDRMRREARERHEAARRPTILRTIFGPVLRAPRRSNGASGRPAARTSSPSRGGDSGDDDLDDEPPPLRALGAGRLRHVGHALDDLLAELDPAGAP